MNTEIELYVPKSRIATPNTEALHTPYSGTLDPCSSRDSNHPTVKVFISKLQTWFQEINGTYFDLE